MWIIWWKNKNNEWKKFCLNNTINYSFTEDGPKTYKCKKKGEVFLMYKGKSWVIEGPKSKFKKNGLPVDSSNRVLKEKDEIIIHGVGRFIILFERKVEVVKYDGDRELNCPVCGSQIKGECVNCPSCSIWTHLQCWKFVRRCPTYGCPFTDLDQREEWSPKEIER
jgi:hypothetical protein